MPSIAGTVDTSTKQEKKNNLSRVTDKKVRKPRDTSESIIYGEFDATKYNYKKKGCIKLGDSILSFIDPRVKAIHP